MLKDDEKGYEIGYGKPPKNQYQKGQSGNPKGRPKGAKNKAAAFNAFMQKPLPGHHNVNTREALWRTLQHQALIEKNPRAIKILLDLDARLSSGVYANASSSQLKKKIVQLEEDLNKARSDVGGGVLVVPAEVGLDEFLRLAEEQRQKMLAHQAKSAIEAST